MLNTFRTLALLAALGGLPVAAAAQPTGEPVTIVVGYAAGGTGDVIAKVLADGLPARIGRPVTIVNRPGASGAVAATSVARAAPDGRTLLLGQTAEMAITYNLLKEAAYAPDRDFAPVAMVATAPLVLVVPNSSRLNSVADIVEASRSSDRGLVFASSGVGTPGHLAGEILRLRLDARLRHAPFEGSGVGVDAMLNGQADLYFAALPAVLPLIKSGRLKAIAVSGGQRSPLLPNVPTLGETGKVGTEPVLWLGVFAPAATPENVTEAYHRAINAILSEEAARGKITELGLTPRPMSTAELRDFLRAEVARYAAVIQDDFCSKTWTGGCMQTQD